VILVVRLTPKAREDAVTGIELLFDGAPVLRARVRAIPERGRANAALARLIADWLGVPASSVNVAQGSKSRLKQVSVEGDPDRLTSLIATRLAELASSS
jgi:uncharacterized protein